MKKFLLYILPKSLLSRFIGIISELPLPMFFREAFYKFFSKIYLVKLDEIEGELKDFSTFASFFTRDLKKGLRPISNDFLIAPVDGCCVEQGVIEDGLLIQAKGIKYSVNSIFNESKLKNTFGNGDLYWTFYLAPGDYHHIHSPCNGRIINRLYVSGSLYPVNDFTRMILPSLYSKNERVITTILSNEGEIGLVMVGAMNVGSIGLSFDPEFRDLVFKKELKHNLKLYENSIDVKKGDRLATFYLGSTVILFAKRKSQDVFPDIIGQKVLYGQSLKSRSSR